MAMYQRKALVVEARQWFKQGDHPNVCNPDESNVGDVSEGICCGTQLWYTHGILNVPKKERLICPGDWIITCPDGQVSACKPDIFAETYEPAGDS